MAWVQGDFMARFGCLYYIVLVWTLLASGVKWDGSGGEVTRSDHGMPQVFVGGYDDEKRDTMREDDEVRTGYGRVLTDKQCDLEVRHECNCW